MIVQGPQTYALLEPVDAPIGQEGELQTYLPPSLPKVSQDRLYRALSDF